MNQNDKKKYIYLSKTTRHPLASHKMFVSWLRELDEGFCNSAPKLLKTIHMGCIRRIC